jgi:hypothetical protein
VNELRDAVASAWAANDPSGEVRARSREGGTVDVTVVSALFEGQGNEEREALFWPAIRHLPATMLARMTYTLLVTPGEAAEFFSEPPTARKDSP